MKLTVKLYGTLGRSVDAYDHRSGLGICLGEGAVISDLFIHLNLDPKGIGMIFMDGGHAEMDTLITEGARIKIFQPIFGG